MYINPNKIVSSESCLSKEAIKRGISLDITEKNKIHFLDNFLALF